MKVWGFKDVSATLRRSMLRRLLVGRHCDVLAVRNSMGRRVLPVNLSEAKLIADRVVAELAPHCHRIEIAGSIRRKKPDVKDIEVVAIPKEYDTGLFASGVAKVAGRWEKVKGDFPCKYTQRILPEGIALDLFFATADNWGLIYAIRTGSAEYSHQVLACGWVARGFKSVDGMLMRDGFKFPCPEESDLFRLAGVDWIEPEFRVVA